MDDSTSIENICKIWGFHGDGYEECRLQVFIVLKKVHFVKISFI
jgi:hypothetical protein